MLPDGLERLEFLRTLDLSNNRLKEIPPGLGEMRSERERGREDSMTEKRKRVGGSDITFCLLLYLFFSDLSKLLLSENKLTTLYHLVSQNLLLLLLLLLLLFKLFYFTCRFGEDC